MLAPTRKGGRAYRGRVIVLDPATPPDRPGRYTVDGRPFSQLATAKAWIDTQGGAYVPAIV